MRYELLSRIGFGGMAEVFKARSHGEEGFRKELVLKRILPHLSADKDFRTRFIDEAKLAVALRHANIVQVFDLGRIGHQLFIAMELVDGVDLAWLLTKLIDNERVLPTEHALFITAELLKGLHYAHHKTGESGQPLEIVHRDISPPNVLLSMSGEVKLCDFGIARAAERTFHTKDGLVVGKIPYMAPEQVEAGAVDGRTDLYSVGIILNTMLAGVHPYEGDTDMQMIHRITSGDLPAPSTHNKEIPAELDAIALKATARVANLRYQNAEEFLEAIEGYALENKLPLGDRALAKFLTEIGAAPPEGEPVHNEEVAPIDETPDAMDLPQPHASPSGPALAAPLADRKPGEFLEADSSLAVDAISWEEKQDLFDFSGVEEKPVPEQARPGGFLELQTPPPRSKPDESYGEEPPDSGPELETPRKIEHPQRVVRIQRYGATPLFFARLIGVAGLVGAGLTVWIAYVWGAL